MEAVCVVALHRLCFYVWQHGEENLKSFLNIINSCHPTIKFTSEYSAQKINFLNVQIIHERTLCQTCRYTPVSRGFFLSCFSFKKVYLLQPKLNVFQNIPVVGFRRRKSLKDVLVRAKLPEKVSGGMYCKCGRKRCAVCQYITTGNPFPNSENCRNFSVRSGSLDCNSKLVVYLVRCKTCCNQYVGSASTKCRLLFQ